MALISNAKNFLEEKKKNITKAQIVGFVLFAIATVGYLGLFISFLGFLKSFILGFTGFLSYGLYFIFYFFAGSLMKNKKLPASTKQIVFASFSLVLILAIFHIALFENAQTLTYGEYLTLTYQSKASVGGWLFSVFLYPIIHYLSNIGAYFVLGILLVIFVGLLVDSFSKKDKVQKSQKVQNRKTINSKQKIVSIPIDFERRKNEINLERELDIEPASNEIIGLQEDIKRPQTPKEIAMQKLGLDNLDQKREEYIKGVQNGNFGFINGYSAENIKTAGAVKEENNSKPKMVNHTLNENKISVNKSYDEMTREEKNRMFLDATFNKSFLFNKEIENNNEDIKDKISGVETTPRTNVFNDSVVKNSASENLSPTPKFINETMPKFVSESESATVSKTTETTNDSLINLQESKTDKENLDNKIDDLFNIDLNPASDFDLQPLKLPEELKVGNDRRRINPNIINTSIKNAGEQTQETKQEEFFKAKESFEKKFENEPISQEQKEYKVAEVLSSKPQEEQKQENVYVKPPMYVRPSMDLLINTSTNPEEYGGDYTQKAQNIEERLASFNIGAKVKNVTCGPQVTRYELEMPLGVSVNKVVTYQNDIAASVASNHGVRIEAPIPGKNAVGVEVPNDKIATVSLKEVLDSPEFFTSKSLTTFALGKAIDGSLKVCDLSSMPHVVVAGSTGSGKSVCLNSLIVSILFRAGPEDVKFILIDPKMVEFSLFNGLPHLILPKAITDVDKAVNALKWVAEEMDRRYMQLSVNQVKKIEEYNELPEIVEGKKAKMPYIVVVVDEVADLMSQNKKEVENYVARIAAKARAAGIHLVLATQRPSVDVITGTIKNNLPSRIAFAVTSQVDSRTILDRVGAENLLGRGDLLYINSTMSEPMRYQGCFVSNKEVKAVCDFIRENNKCNYDENIAAEINKSKSAGGGDGAYDDNYELDPYFKHALKLVIEAGGASTSLLQRKFRWGYQRSARVIDQMEEKGYIGAVDGSKPRAVYLSLEDYYKLFGND